MANEKTGEYAILHKQICDNFERCPSMLACEESGRKYGHPTAIYINEEGKIDINKNNCIGCANCMEKCGLFRIVSSLYKELEFLKEFDDDPRNKLNFTVERFGCDLINKQEYSINDISLVDEYIRSTQNDEVNILEFVDENLVMCPFQAIEVDYIKNQFACIGEYRKYVIGSSEIDTFKRVKKLFGIDRFPAILLIYKGKVLGKPIDTEFRVVSEDQRVQVQILLHTMILERLLKGGIINEVH